MRFAFEGPPLGRGTTPLSLRPQGGTRSASKQSGDLGLRHVIDPQPEAQENGPPKSVPGTDDTNVVKIAAAKITRRNLCQAQKTGRRQRRNWRPMS